MTTLHLPLDRASPNPLHRQIYDGVRRAILDGRLRPGQRLPASRTLAEELGVSRLPVLSAYEQLLHEGYLAARIGSGTFVSQGSARRPAGGLGRRHRVAAVVQSVGDVERRVAAWARSG